MPEGMVDVQEQISKQIRIEVAKIKAEQKECRWRDNRTYWMILGLYRILQYVDPNPTDILEGPN